MQLDRVGQRHRAGEHQLGAARGHIAHEAIRAMAAVVEKHATLQEALLTRIQTPFRHGKPPLKAFSGKGATGFPSGVPEPAGWTRNSGQDYRLLVTPSFTPP